MLLEFVRLGAPFETEFPNNSYNTMIRNQSRSPNKYQSSFLLHFSSNLYSDLWALMTSQVSKRDQSKYDICTTVMPSFIRHDSFRWASMSLVVFSCYLQKRFFFILRNLAETLTALSENCKDCVIKEGFRIIWSRPFCMTPQGEPRGGPGPWGPPQMQSRLLLSRYHP